MALIGSAPTRSSASWSAPTRQLRGSRAAGEPARRASGNLRGRLRPSKNLMDAAARAAFARVVPAFVLGAPHHARARRFGMPQSSVAINYGDAPGDLAPYRD